MAVRSFGVAEEVIQMSDDCVCPEYKEKYKDVKIKDKMKAPETEKEPEPVQEKKKSWWEKFKDRIDPAGVGGLPQPSMGW